MCICALRACVGDVCVCPAMQLVAWRSESNFQALPVSFCAVNFILNSDLVAGAHLVSPQKFPDQEIKI